MSTCVYLSAWTGELHFVTAVLFMSGAAAKVRGKRRTLFGVTRAIPQTGHTTSNPLAGLDLFLQERAVAARGTPPPAGRSAAFTVHYFTRDKGTGGRRCIPYDREGISQAKRHHRFLFSFDARSSLGPACHAARFELLLVVYAFCLVAKKRLYDANATPAMSFLTAALSRKRQRRNSWANHIRATACIRMADRLFFTRRGYLGRRRYRFLSSVPEPGCASPPPSWLPLCAADTPPLHRLPGVRSIALGES